MLGIAGLVFGRDLYIGDDICDVNVIDYRERFDVNDLGRWGQQSVDLCWYILL